MNFLNKRPTLQQISPNVTITTTFMHAKVEPIDITWFSCLFIIQLRSRLLLPPSKGFWLSMKKEVVDVDDQFPMVCRYWSDFETFVMCFEG